MQTSATVWATVLVILTASCAPASTATSAASATPITPTVAASPTSRSVAFPDLPFIVGTNGGDLYFQLVNGQPAGRKIHACDGTIANLVATGREALFLCHRVGSIPTLYLYNDDTGTVAAIAKTEGPSYALTGTGEAVYVTIGKQEGSAPIPTTRLMLVDVRTGATTQLDERYGVAFDLRLTGEGVMVWRPQNSLSFRRAEADAGTWILRGTALTKLSLHRLVGGTPGRDLLESEPVDPSTGYWTSSCCTFVVLKTSSEQRLTPTDVRDERGLALLDDGRVVTWQAEQGEYDGSVVIYNGTKVERSDRGRFGAFRVLRAGDWLVAQEAAPTPALHAYRISDGAFAAVPTSGFSALAILGPKK